MYIKYNYFYDKSIRLKKLNPVIIFIRVLPWKIGHWWKKPH